MRQNTRSNMREKFICDEDDKEVDLVGSRQNVRRDPYMNLRR